MSLRDQLPAPWQPVLAEEFDKPYMAKLEAFLDQEYAAHTVFPPRDQIFSAYELTPFNDVKVLILGQDPYHGPGQAHGLSFSVRPGVTTPPSLHNMYKELKTDLGCTMPNNGFLLPWAKQGVMMLNAVLTVRQAEPNSHQKQGWEKFTDATIRKLGERDKPMIFVLWGGKAKEKLKLINSDKHFVLTGAHPSPLSAHNGFFGSKPFSKVNEKLTSWGQEGIDWQIPNV